jgi:hypothetical protein
LQISRIGLALLVFDSFLEGKMNVIFKDKEAFDKFFEEYKVFNNLRDKVITSRMTPEQKEMKETFEGVSYAPEDLN